MSSGAGIRWLWASAALVLLVLVAWMSVRTVRQPPAGTSNAAAPKLAILIVVDQMRADYVERFKNDWTGGFKRLLNEGAWFSRAAYPYLSTVTCAGHATISTGTFPHTHGVIGNGWFDRERGQTMSCTEDPAVQDIGYVSQGGDGQSAYRMVVSNFADLMRSQRGAQVVALSQKERSAIMLAGHGPGIVTWLALDYGSVMTSSAFSNEAVPLVKAFVEAHPLGRDSGKTWDRVLPPSRYPEADDGAAEIPPPGWTRTFPHVLDDLRGGQPDARFREQWNRSPFVDAYLAELADALLSETSLGRHASSDVLAISFSGTDEVGHKFGPQSQEVHDTLIRLDGLLGRLFDRVDALVGRNQYVVALSSDHGVTPASEELLKRDDRGFLDAGSVSDKIEQLLQRSFGPGRYVAELQGDNMNLYFTPGTYQRLQDNAGVLREVIDAIQSTPGIQRVLRSEEAASGLASSDPVLRQAALSYYPSRSGDLLLLLQPGWISVPGLAVNHGLGASADDQAVPIFFMGRGVKPGEYRDPSTPADIAPTLSALCGISMAKVEGQVLTAIMKP